MRFSRITFGIFYDDGSHYNNVCFDNDLFVNFYDDHNHDQRLSLVTA